MSRTRLSLFGILLLALFLRVLNLDARAIWYDEAFAVLYAEKSFAQMWYGTVTSVEGAAADVHPLFFYTLLHGWMDWVGQSAFAVRFFSVGFSVATVAVVYRLARAVFPSRPVPLPTGEGGKDIALLAALIVAVAPFAIAYGQEARMYALLGFFSALFVLAYVMIEKGLALNSVKGLRGWWLVFVLSGAAMLYSHNLAVFFGAALAVWIFARAVAVRRAETFHRNVPTCAWHILSPNLQSLIPFVIAGAAILMLWLPWLMLLPSQLGKIQQAYWIGTPDALTGLQTLLTFVVDFDNARLPPLLVPFALLAALLVALLLLFEIARGGWRETRVLFFALLATLPPLLIFLVSHWRPVYLTRALMPSFVMLTILVAWLLTRVPKIFAWGLGIGLAACTLASFAFYYTYADFPRPPFRDALKFLSAQVSPRDVVVHDNKVSYFPMYYYARAQPLHQKFVEDPKGGGSDTLASPTQAALGLCAESLASAVSEEERVWFIMFREAREESAQAANLELLRAKFRLNGEWAFHDLEIYLFEK